MGVWDGFQYELKKLAKKKEFAPGIPEKKIHPISKKEEPEVVPFVVQEHQARRAGLHYDMRLGDPRTGHAHSWAIRHLPDPGERRLAVQQPTHSIPYMEFEGIIPEGYGAGKVKKHKKGPAEIIYSDDNRIKFNLYPGSDTEEYNLIRTRGNKWLILNTTPTVESNPDVPQSKPKYKEVKKENIRFDEDDKLMMGKLDGAHVSMEIKPGKPIRLYSYRPRSRGTGIIQHTYRVPKAMRTLGKEEHGETILRGEIYGKDRKTGKSLDSTTIGGMLNSNVLKSREKQMEKGELIPAPFDVVKWKGKNFENMPYKEKMKVLRDISKAYDMFELPHMAYKPRDKADLYNKIKFNRDPQTKEGVVQWPLYESGPPEKTKFKPTYDVRVTDVFQKQRSREKGYAGGFEYTEVDGEKTRKVGRVGTGFSDKLRRDMANNPEKYRNLVAAVEAQTKYDKSGVLRAPSFQLWHLDKNPPSSLRKVVPK